LAKSALAVKARTQAERRGEAERRILEASIKLLVERGYDRFTLAEVGERAGYSRGLPAHYFGKKDDLLSQVAMFIISQYYDAIADTEAVEPGLPRLLARIRRYIQGYGSPGNRALSVLVAQARFHATLRRTITELNQRARARWQAEVRAGIERGNIRPGVDPEAIGSMIHAFVRGQSTFVDMDPGYDVKSASEGLIDVVLEKLTPERNRSPEPRAARDG
jgi:TetR/AcrR family acrAB operon transcriptional repressor